MRKYLAVVGMAVVIGTVATAQLPELPGLPGAKKTDWYKTAVKSVDAKFEPEQAKPGQVVKFILTVDLNDGYYTYPARQFDKAAANMVNQFDFPEGGPAIFVSRIRDPIDYKVKAEPELKIRELITLPGKAVYERPAVVSPKAKPGEYEIEVPFHINVCDKDNCFPPKKLNPTAKLEVLSGPAVSVEEKYRNEVDKALEGM